MASKAQQKAKQQAKTAVRQATSSGQAVSQQQVKALSKAGVNTSNAQKLITANQQAVQSAQRQASATAAQQQMNPAIDTAIRNQANQGNTIGQQFYDSPEFQQVLNTAGGMSAQQVADYAKSQGFGLGDQWMQQYGTTNAGKMKMTDAKNLAQALRIAGARGKTPNLVSKKELNYLTDEFGKSGLNVLGRMDKLNSNTASKGMNPLGIKSGLYNQIFSGKYGDTSYRPMGKYDGPLAQNLFAMGDSFMPRTKDQESKIIPGAGKMPKGFGVFGRYNGQPIFSQGTGKNWSDTRFGQDQITQYTPFYTPPEADPGNGPGDGDPTAVVADPVVSDPVTNPDAMQNGAGADLSSFATGWKGKKGSRAGAGRKAQGTGSMRIAPSYGAGVGTNYG